MAEIASLISGSDCLELEFSKREAIPMAAMKLDIRLYLAGLLLSDIVSILEFVDGKRCRSTMDKFGVEDRLQPVDGSDPDHVGEVRLMKSQSSPPINNDGCSRRRSRDQPPAACATLYYENSNAEPQ